MERNSLHRNLFVELLLCDEARQMARPLENGKVVLGVKCKDLATSRKALFIWTSITKVRAIRHQVPYLAPDRTI